MADTDKGSQQHERTSSITRRTKQWNKNSVRYKKGGSAGLEGILFQVDILTILLLNAFENLENWKLSTENKECGGKFDDAILEWPEGCIFLQCKHRKNKNKRITSEDLFSVNSKKSDFSLGKYFYSFQDIKSKFVVKDVIICSNVDVDLSKGLEDLIDERQDNCRSMLYYYDQECSFYTFKDIALPMLEEHIRSYCTKNLKEKNSTVSSEDVKDFLKHLKLYFNYPCDSRLYNIIKELSSHITYFHDLCCHTVSKYIHNEMLEWFRQDKGDYLTEVHVKSMLCQIRSSKYCDMLEQYDINFRRNLEFKDRVNHIIAEDAHLLKTLHVYRSLQQVEETQKLYVTSEDELALEEAVMTFHLPQYTFLIIFCPKIQEDYNLQGTSRKLTEMLQEHQYKKIIFIAEKNNNLVQHIKLNWDVFEMDRQIELSDLSANTQSKLLNHNIIFQENEITLRKLLDTQVTIDELSKVFYSDTLEKLITKENIVVGSSVTQFDESYYIHRKFNREIAEDGPRNIEMLIKSKQTFSEENIYDLSEKLVLITDSAGTGKTTFLIKAAVDMKRKFPHLWIIRIQLNDYTNILNELKDKNREEMFIEELLNSSVATKLKNRIEEVIFFTKNKVVLMLDGVDEISPDYTDLILSLLMKCGQAANFVKVFVTARSHMTMQLEKKLQVKPFKLEPFTKQDQIDFLTNYWAYNLKLKDSEIKFKRYAEALLSKIVSWIDSDKEKGNDFVTVPLQVRMLAEVFQENNKQFDQSNHWQGCIDYLRSSEETEPKLPETIEIMKLYQMFIEKKRDIFISKENPSGQIAAKQALIDKFYECLRYYQNRSLEIILNRNNCNLFKFYKTPDRGMMPYILKIGIVKESDTGFAFIHRTFTEYFVAECLLVELQQGNGNWRFQRFFLNEILLKLEYKTVRAFLDNLLQECKDTVPITAFKNYQSFRVRINLSEMSNPVLIHELAEEGCVAIVQLLYKCLGFKIVTTREVDMKNSYFKILSLFSNKTLRLLEYLVKQGGVNVKDKEGMTPLHYAARQGHQRMVKFLVNNGANVHIKSDIGSTAIWEAVANGNSKNIATYLLNAGADVNIQVGNLPLLHYAVCHNNLGMVELLIQNGVDLNTLGPDYFTGLHVAALLGRSDITRYLVERGADLELTDRNGCTALHLAVLKINFQEKNPRNSYSDSYLLLERDYKHWVILLRRYCDHREYVVSFERELHLEVLKHLLKHGANVNAIDKRGFTPVSIARRRNQRDTVSLMLPCSTDVDSIDNDTTGPAL